MEGISGMHEGVRNPSKSAEMGVTELGSSMESAVEWLNSAEGVEGEDARCGRAQMDFQKAECGKDPCTEPLMEDVQPDGTVQNVKPIVGAENAPTSPNSLTGSGDEIDFGVIQALVSQKRKSTKYKKCSKKLKYLKKE